MRKLLARTCAAIIALHSTGILSAAQPGWLTDFEAAKNQAAESRKDLLLLFTGSDWCPGCIQLDNEVLKHDAFNSGVKDSFVLVEIDFPQDESKLPDATKKQNAELEKHYAVPGFPTILLCDAEGLPYAATTYEPGGPEAYITHLNGLKANKLKRDEAFAAAEKAEGVTKARMLIAALEGMALEYLVIDRCYDGIVAKIKAADPADETGFAKKAAARKRLADFQDALDELSEKKDLDGAMELVEKTLKAGGFDTEETLQLMMTRALIFAEQKNFDQAIKAAGEAKAFAPDSPLVPQIEDFIKQLENEKSQPSAPPAKEAKPGDLD